MADSSTSGDVPPRAAPAATPPAAPAAHPAPESAGAHPADPPAAPPAAPAQVQRGNKRHWVRWAVVAAVVVVTLVLGVPWAMRAWSTVSTDDAYVNGHVTLVAPRVPGQVAQVFVEDNNRVRKGDLLFTLDKGPYRVRVNIAQAAVAAAQADLANTQAQVRSLEAETRSRRYTLQHAMEDVDNRIAELHARVATLESRKATLTEAQADYKRAEPLLSSGAVTREELDQRNEALQVAKAQVDEALQGVYQARVSLGLSAQPAPGEELGHVPAGLDQTFSSVRVAQANLMASAAQLGVTHSFDDSPAAMLASFYQRDPQGNVDRIFKTLLAASPAVKQSEAKVAEAQRALDQARLNLSYCAVYAEIDGVVTRRNVNPGDNLVAGQSVLAVRSLTDIWVDANFKETQLALLRIGQPVDLDVDMYGSRRRFEGRISGFTMGTGSTLALLPPENATGNFVKVVQRLPVRIDVIDYDPDAAPLFAGLSVTPYVHVYAKPTGPDAGRVLQPYLQPAAAPASQPETAP